MFGEPNDVRFGEARIIVLDQPTVNKFISPQKQIFTIANKVTNQTKPTGRTLQSNQLTDQSKIRRPTQNKRRNCGWQIVISEWSDTPKRLLGQKTYFWGNNDF